MRSTKIIQIASLPGRTKKDPPFEIWYNLQRKVALFVTDGVVPEESSKMLEIGLGFWPTFERPQKVRDRTVSHFKENISNITIIFCSRYLDDTDGELHNSVAMYYKCLGALTAEHGKELNQVFEWIGEKTA